MPLKLRFSFQHIDFEIHSTWSDEVRGVYLLPTSVKGGRSKHNLIFRYVTSKLLFEAIDDYDLLIKNSTYKK